MPKATGKYLLIENMASIFGPDIRFAKTRRGLKLGPKEKRQILDNQSLLFSIKRGEIMLENELPRV